MSYSDLLATQERELELLNQSYYADQAMVKKLRNDHYNASRFDGQLQRLQELHERRVKEVQARFEKEQRDYLGEPTPAPPLPDISQSQDKALNMIRTHRQRESESCQTNQQDATGGQPAKQTQAVKGQPVDEAEVKKLAQQAREKREQKSQHYRRGFKR